MSKFYILSKSRWLIFGISVMFGAASAHAATTLAIPQVPLQTGSDVPANIMFLIDDSGSMRWGFMPDSLAERIPKWNNSDREFFTECASFGNYAGVTNTCFMGTDSLLYLVSSRLNQSYYDPSKTYLPPLNAAGNRYANASFNNAKIDGYINSSSSVNLSSNYRAIMDDYYYYGWKNGNRYGFTVSEGGNASRAFYYNYVATRPGCNNEYDDACYVKVSVPAAQETNFANWFSFYRTRLLSSKYGIGTAFNTLPEHVRVGYGALNTSDKIESGVLAFTGTGKTGFYNWLYAKTASGSTPLRTTLKAAGEYFKTDEPYRVNPATEGSTLVSCRQNFTILMTDGAWNGGSPGVGDSDGDEKSNTLADVAHHYYTTDLSTLTNNVPKRTTGSPDWQHMVTFGVGLGVEGTLNSTTSSSWAPDDSRWPDPTVAPNISLKKIDDLLHASVNSDGGFFSAKDPQTFSNQLAEALRGILNRVASSSNLAATTTSLLEDNSVFQASFNTANWSGNLVSRDVSDLSLQWSANFDSWQDRPIYTSRTSGGVTSTFEFEWDKLSTSEKTALESNDIVDYLKGDRDNEKPSGVLRERVSVLGDIAHSSPVFVGAPQNRNYQRYVWGGASSYAQFLADQQNRSPVVYVGANDGMLHGFDADPNSTTRGKEIFAYVPQRMLTAAAQLSSYAKDNYSHRFYVDGSATVSDVYIDNKWRSVLVSTLGRGGNSVFALDVTDPSEITLLWDLTIPELGMMTAKPVITRLNNDRWAAVMPYGYNNSVNKSGLLVIDIENGGTPIKIELPDTAGALGQPEGWDQNKNGNTDWFFAGDLKGNLWKFDLSSSVATSWVIAGGEPLFVATDTALKRQPITGGVTLQSHPTTAELWIFFGTGKFIESGDSVNTDVQSWYGIKDGATILGRSQLVSRTASNVEYTNPDTSESRTARNVGVAAQNDMNGKRGWVMDLPDTRERITSKPRFIGGNLIMNTIIPDTDLCNPQGDGWIMAVDPFAGSRLKGPPFFDMDRDEDFDEGDNLPGNIPPSGIKIPGMPGEPVFVDDEMLVGDSKVSIDSSRVNLQIRRGRLSWREMINQ